MNFTRERTTHLVVGLMCVLAVGIAASTLTSVVGTGGGQAVFSTNEDMVSQGSGSTNQGQGDPGTEIDQSRLDLQMCVPFLQKTVGKLALAGGAALILYIIYRRINLSATILSAWAGAPPVLFLYFAMTSDCFSGSSRGGGGGAGGGNPLQNGGGGLASPSSIPPWMIGIVFGLVVIGAVAVVLTARGSETIEPPSEEDQAEAMPDIDPSDVAAAAGRAADRIEEGNVDIDNEVYRAWREMTNLLNVSNPDSSTPGEFARAAIDAGMERDDITDLTRLFEQVRYGGLDVTEEREQFAVDIFRNVEEQYSEEHEDDGDDDDEPTDGDN
ncbi:DUF4129 domain-containing protein [Halosimplex pelagicum]|uniref:DUF4129 domain-containing protein n=1 Tax=Halosimplex pelagicum TaxID=869886 RepID=A0A7D5P998_9EURY|nr:DUF4129 domain-containing protein [Halosimplex pelagicum]QLH82004.1 DUF4129 domain-containing protein [Halosimplex pelagicum]